MKSSITGLCNVVQEERTRTGTSLNKHLITVTLISELLCRPGRRLSSGDARDNVDAVSWCRTAAWDTHTPPQPVQTGLFVWRRWDPSPPPHLLLTSSSPPPHLLFTSDPIKPSPRVLREKSLVWIDPWCSSPWRFTGLISGPSASDPLDQVFTFPPDADLTPRWNEQSRRMMSPSDDDDDDDDDVRSQTPPARAAGAPVNQAGVISIMFFCGAASTLSCQQQPGPAPPRSFSQTLCGVSSWVRCRVSSGL
ncbi:unnamed protein product [Pleuronectes platessa]|uniref:Uncharacterized protein n=1 Tax=Pleuronectes platessa TaxID=8262 RepID=A0A9N7UEW6_PLEPL|nr:unnamed protein product [Pleuronectes platessa]